MGFPKPPGVAVGNDQALEKTGEGLDRDDANFIIQQELRPEHRDDPTVLKFINAYLSTRDLRESAKAAGIDTRSARTLRNRRDIHNAITKVTQTAVLKYGLDPDEIVEKVKAVAFFDPVDLVNEDGSVKSNLNDISPEARRAIKKIKIKNLYETDVNGMRVKAGHIAEIEMWDKMKAIEFLGREKGLFKETVKKEYDVTDNMKDVLLGSRERAAERRARLREAQPAREVIDVGGNSETLRDGGGDVQGDRGSNDPDGKAGPRDVQEAANTVGVYWEQDGVESSKEGTE